MTLFMTPDELGKARESRDFWRSKKAPDMQMWQLLGGEAGETGFKWKIDSEGKEYTPAGDNGMARGSNQWWPARGNLILKETGFDVRFGTHMDCLNGAFLEMTALWSPYRRVWRDLMAAKTPWACQSELVKAYEGSRNQGPDIVKRVAYAAYLQHELG